MHWLRMFLLAWLSLGTVTLVFLFWLCKRTAAVKDPIKLRLLSPSDPEFGASTLSNRLRSRLIPCWFAMETSLWMFLLASMGFVPCLSRFSRKQCSGHRTAWARDFHAAPPESER